MTTPTPTSPGAALARKGGGCPVVDIFAGKLDSASVTARQVIDIWSAGYDGAVDEVEVEIWDRP